MAPAAWKRIEFASDLHLCASAPHTFRAFENWLLGTSADAVFLLGDVFELWIGDDIDGEGFAVRCLETLAAYAKRPGRQLCFMAGNRDFLLGERALRQAAAVRLPDPVRLDVFGQRLLLSHGDALCLDDQTYQAFRQMVRASRWQDNFLARPRAERATVAQRIRQDSQARKGALPDRSLWADVDADASRSALNHAQAHTLVHGHTHRPGTTALGQGLERITLPDWDLDHAHPPRGYVLGLDANGWHPCPLDSCAAGTDAAAQSL